LTLALAAAAAMVEGLSAAAQPFATPWDTVQIAVGLLAMIALDRFLAGRRGGDLPRWSSIVLAAAMGIPILSSALSRGPGMTGEYWFLAGLRNGSLAAAAMGYWPRMQRVAAAGSLFVVLFSFALASGTLLTLATAVYLVIGVFWLMASEALPATATPVGRTAVPYAAAVPLVPAVLISLATLCVMAVTLLAYPDELTAAGEFLSRWMNPRVMASAQGTRASDLKSLRRFLNGLADAKYGAPNRSQPGKGTGSLGKVDAQQDDLLTREREEVFSLVRTGRKAGQAADDPRRSLFQVAGQSTLHLPVATYDRFDGSQWYPEPVHAGPLNAADVTPQKSWLTSIDRISFSLDARQIAQARAMLRKESEGNADLVAEARAAAAKWASQWGGGPLLEPQVFPISPERIRSLVQAPGGFSDDPSTMFTPYDVTELAEALDHGSALHDRLLELAQRPHVGMQEMFREYLRWRMARHDTVLPAGVWRLVQTWTAGHRPGWDQVEAVIQGLRQHCRHEPSARVPPGTRDTVSYFLLESRQGPDYLFASTAAVLLRSIGTPSRMVGGYYADPANRSLFTGRTTIRASDVHYWVQGRLPDGTWCNLEPTPGFEAVDSTKTFWARLQESAVAGSAWAAGHAWMLPALLGLVLAAWFCRAPVAATLGEIAWLRRVRGSSDRAVLATWTLLEQRSRRAGCPRPRGATLGDWYPQRIAAVGVRRRLCQLAELADWAVHSPGGLSGQDHWTQGEISRLCRETVEYCTTATFKESSRR
jgi:hypothetical protein